MMVETDISKHVRTWGIGCVLALYFIYAFCLRHSNSRVPSSSYVAYIKHVRCRCGPFLMCCI